MSFIGEYVSDVEILDQWMIFANVSNKWLINEVENYFILIQCFIFKSKKNPNRTVHPNGAAKRWTKVKKKIFI